MQSRTIPRAEHGISRAQISDHALKVLYRLKAEGFAAYLVGGGVRDLLLHRVPKDFDVATDAHPEQVRKIFRNCRLIGRRFRLAHVFFGPEIIEVATFRAAGVLDESASEHRALEDGRILRDNLYGTIEEDAWRRDFTVNALYYNIEDFSVIDYVGGYADLKAGMLGLIGDPITRYREDPVRMLRAVRFAARLNLRIHAQAEQPLYELGGLLDAIPPARLFEEVLKLFMYGHGAASLALLRHYDLFRHLFADTAQALAEDVTRGDSELLSGALASCDARVADGKSITPTFLIAALLWAPVHRHAATLRPERRSDIEALMEAGDRTIARTAPRVAIPRRFSLSAREIWLLQPRFEQRQGRRPLRLTEHPRFRAAYDFLLLRAAAGEADAALAQWWRDFIESDDTRREGMLQPEQRAAGRRRRRRPRAAASAGNT